MVALGALLGTDSGDGGTNIVRTNLLEASWWRGGDVAVESSVRPRRVELAHVELLFSG
jgi:hypothetical protein